MVDMFNGYKWQGRALEVRGDRSFVDTEEETGKTILKDTDEEPVKNILKRPEEDHKKVLKNLLEGEDINTEKPTTENKDKVYIHIATMREYELTV